MTVKRETKWKDLKVNTISNGRCVRPSVIFDMLSVPVLLFLCKNNSYQTVLYATREKCNLFVS